MTHIVSKVVLNFSYFTDHPADANTEYVLNYWVGFTASLTFSLSAGTFVHWGSSEL